MATDLERGCGEEQPGRLYLYACQSKRDVKSSFPSEARWQPKESRVSLADTTIGLVSCMGAGGRGDDDGEAVEASGL